jgi:hypothetical protein
MLATTETLSSHVEIGLLKNTGFDARLSVIGLHKKYQTNIEQGLPQSEAILQPLAETEADIKGYKLEYMMFEPWLPNPLEVRSYQGRNRIFNKFSNLPISEGITRQERFGAVADAMEAIEPKLLRSPNNSRFVMYSPAGWSGMTDRNGNPINYPEAQMFFFEKDEKGNFQANTLVMDEFTTNEAKRFYAAFGYTNPDWLNSELDQKDRLAKMVRNVIELPDTTETFETIVRKVQIIRQTEIVRHLPDGRVRTFDEVYQKMQKGNELLQMDDQCQAQIEAFKTFVTHNKESLDVDFTQMRVQHELEKTILNIARIVRGDEPIIITSIKQMRQAFSAEITYLGSIGGCGGGGGELSILQTPLGPRLGRSEKGWKYEIGDCVAPGCGKTKVEVGPCDICKDCEKLLPKA